MEERKIIHKKEITDTDIKMIEQIIKENPTWHRTKISQELCKIWNWRTYNGQYKDMSCREMLRRLAGRGIIELPESKRQRGKSIENIKQNENQLEVEFNREEGREIRSKLGEIKPIQIEVINKGKRKELYSRLLSEYHYLGYKRHVGEHMKYLILDRGSNPISCLLFGSAALTITERDKYIGWSTEKRRSNLHYVTNNMRFLILPWIRIKNLASYILSQISRRIVGDWIERYNHPIYLIETFVDGERYQGTCYKASNWIRVGQTKGRTRNDRYGKIKVSIKDIYLYPLVKDFRELLNK